MSRRVGKLYIYDTTALGRNCFMGTSGLFYSALKDTAAEMTLNFLFIWFKMFFFLIFINYTVQKQSVDMKG